MTKKENSPPQNYTFPAELTIVDKLRDLLKKEEKPVSDAETNYAFPTELTLVDRLGDLIKGVFGRKK